ncbi:MAG TPA: potassium channel protein [Candidatus Binataceae bacterium]|jgi:voltage-gated potassium channel|nr:potassium channel protein [Candidatus Binataceae bacterium]
MNPGRRFLAALAGIVVLTLGGTAGYMAIERMTPLDALYMTVITISTVGYHEVKPLDTSGRLFTMALIITGVGAAFYLFAAITQFVVEGQLREFLGRAAMKHRIDQLEGHIVICGYGRMGRVVAEEMAAAGLPMVVIERDAVREAELREAELLYVIGSALEDRVLEQAGVRRARAIAVATASDADNVYITLSARTMNPTIRILARGESEAGLQHLRMAGADVVISAYQWAGMRLAASILRPSVVDFLELSIPGRGAEIDLEEVRVAAGSTLIGQPISAVERSAPRLRIIALKRGNEPTALIPDPATRIAAGDFLVAIGDRETLRRLA